MLLAVLVALAITVAGKSPGAFLAVACLSIYVAQIHCLGTIGKHEPRRRLLIWQFSLLGHALLFGVVLWVVGDPSLALVLLLPEAASCAIHLAGIHRACTALRTA